VYSYSQDKLAESLRRDGGQPFLVVLRAGATRYPSEVDDPFFSAHNRLPNGLGSGQTSVYADYEATALGCVEQFQFCVPEMQFPSFCSQWGAREQNFWETLQYLGQDYLSQDLVPTLETWDDQSGATASEMLALFLYLPRSLAVFDYIGTRIQIYDKVPLIEKTAFNPIQRWVDTKEQWVLEAETWFMKAFLGAIFLVQDATFWNFKDFEPGFSEKYIREWSLCGRVLLRDGDYTNVNWIGFWAQQLLLH